MFFTERLMLRAFDPEADKAIMLRWQNDEDFMWALRADAPRPTPRDKIKKWMETLAERDSGLPFFVVCERPEKSESPDQLSLNDDLFLKDGKSRYPLVGVLNFHTGAGLFSFVNREVSFGIGLDKAHQGRGYGTELLTWAKEFVFNNLGLHRFSLQAFAENQRAIRCYEKVGFRHEGVSKSCVWRDGQWKDTVNMAMLADEYWEGKDKL